MGFLTSLLTKEVIGSLLGGIIGPATDVWKRYIDKQITEAELKEKLSELMLNSAKEVEVTHAQELTKTYSTFMGAVTTNDHIRRVWTAVTLSQLFVLVWYQWFVPFMVFMDWTTRYPSAGETISWAYALVGSCLGFGVFGLRTGPAGFSAQVSSWKTLIGK